jgi:putative flavoprotein involved in K+ transport
MGMFDTTIEELKSPQAKFDANPQVSGRYGGQTLNLHQFAKDGVVLLGHVRGARDRRLILAPDLKESLVRVDQFEIDTLRRVDEFIARAGIAAPPEMVPQLRDGYEQQVITGLNLEEAGITTILWATGYSFDFSFVKLSVVDADGYPRQKRGATEYEGLYFLGMPWLHNRRSGILFGVADDTAYLAAHIANRNAEHEETAAA